MRTVENLLQDAVSKDHGINWSSLKDHSDYPVPKPTRPNPTAVPPEPLRMGYPPNLGWFARLITPIREKRIAEAEQRFQTAHAAWRSKRAGKSSTVKLPIERKRRQAGCGTRINGTPRSMKADHTSERQ